MTRYDDMFKGGCTLTKKTVLFFEQFKGRGSFEMINGRVYFRASITVYYGSRVGREFICRLIATPSDTRSVQRIEQEAITIGALNGNRHFLAAAKKWFAS